jgi:signal recognition particle receptor subunit beta
VVAVNRFDGKLDHDLEEIREALDISPDVPVITTDARSRDAVKDAVLVLLDLALARAIAKARNR